MQNETAIEAELQAKGLNAPRLTPDRIEETILSEHYARGTDLILAPGERLNVAPLSLSVESLSCLTICVLVLRNGYTVIGTSACASLENYDAEIGRKIARDKAREQIWALEGYLLRDRLAANRTADISNPHKE